MPYSNMDDCRDAVEIGAQGRGSRNERQADTRATRALGTEPRLTRTVSSPRAGLDLAALAFGKQPWLQSVPEPMRIAADLRRRIV